MSTATTKQNTCTCCGYVTDRATCFTSDTQPKPGMIAICARCGLIGVYDEDMSIRTLRQEEKVHLMSNHPDIWNQVMGIHHAVINRNRLN